MEHFGGGSIQEKVSLSLQKGSLRQKAFSHIRLRNTWCCQTTNWLTAIFFSSTEYSPAGHHAALRWHNQQPQVYPISPQKPIVNLYFVWIPDRSERGTVRDQAGPRSYWAGTPIGNFRRNKRDIISISKEKVPSGGSESQDTEVVTDTVVSDSSPHGSTPLQRSQRIRVGTTGVTGAARAALIFRSIKWQNVKAYLRTVCIIPG